MSSMLAYCVCVLKVASIDGLMHVFFLIACHCTVFIVNLLFCYVLGKKISLSPVIAEFCLLVTYDSDSVRSSSGSVVIPYVGLLPVL